MALSDGWYCARGEQRSGPLTTTRMLSAIKAGKLKRNDLVWNEGMAEWKPAGSCPELLPHFKSERAPPPLPAAHTVPVEKIPNSQTSPLRTVGAIFVVMGFVTWFGGEWVILPYNLIGLPVLLVGAVLYFMGRRSPEPRHHSVRDHSE